MDSITAAKIQDISTRCILMCGQEAIVMGLPKEAGYAIHEGLVADNIDNWSEDQFMSWTEALAETFGLENELKLIDLYNECGEILERYGMLIEQTV
jgi:hypothetical protein